MGECAEVLARPQRLAALEAMLKEQTDREDALQARYAEAMRCRQTYMEQLHVANGV